ncbi:MAG: hypothetical protein HY575_07655, partial [candidate division NC10 bacterium]|nr:hypothetical protein [candidate division NC10 bacterium]
MSNRNRRCLRPGGLALAALVAFGIPAGAPPQAAAAKPALETLQAIQEAFVGVAEQVKPSVVNINTTQKVRPPRRAPGEAPPP